STNVGDEGGVPPNIESNEEAVETVIKAIETAGFKPGDQVAIALDAASSEFYDTQLKKYVFHKSDNRQMDSQALADYWEKWCSKYSIVSIEDGMAEDDWEGWQYLTKKLGHQVQLVGDDLFVTNVKRLEQGI